MPTTEPIISGTMIMSRKCVLTTAGFSFGGASFFAYERGVSAQNRSFAKRGTNLAQLLDETHGLALETALEPTAGTGVDELVVANLLSPYLLIILILL